MSYPPIENHGIIGSMETAALVSNDGAIDFMCFPHFDSPTVFASLLDAKRGGFFQIKPESANFSRHQFYRPNTNVLETTFRAGDSIAIVSDFMTMGSSGSYRCLVRRVETVREEVIFRANCAPRFDYGKSGHKVEKTRQGLLFLPDNTGVPPMLLRASVSLKIVNGDAQSRFRLRSGESAWFILEEFSSQPRSADNNWVSAALEKTLRYWESWAEQCTYRGRWREAVQRSALLLALLISKRDGSIIAAPTFGLPEWPGSTRNWDYRYTWVRDASFAMDAFLKLGYTKEAHAIMGWMKQRCRQSLSEKPLQVVYRCNGERKLPEVELTNFEGYKASQPVRIGNAACLQLQLDIYGEFIDSVFFYDQRAGPISFELWQHVRSLVEWVCRNWQRPDDSIWEVRGGTRPFLYSRAMCWLALDRAMKLARHRSFFAPLRRWKRVKEQIYKNISSVFWNAKLKSFVQFPGAKTVDASSLLLSRIGFFDLKSPRWRSTLKTIERQLVEDCFVYRYPSALSKSNELREGTFSACSLWYVEALARTDDLRKATKIFEKFLGLANPLGLYAEQLGPQNEHLGNFPQAISHISLIRAACDLNSRMLEE